MAELAKELVNKSDAAKCDEVIAILGRLKTRFERARTCYAHKLPIELLGMIFLEWAQLNSIAPIIASHVCQYWRDVAVSTRPFWTTLILGRRSFDVKASMWLQRSFNRCHTFRFNPLFSIPLDNPAWLPDPLLSALSAVKDLKLKSEDGTMAVKILDILSDGLNGTLECLSVNVERLVLPYGGSLSCPFFDLSSFVNLQVLDLNNLRIYKTALRCEHLKILRLRSSQTQSSITCMELLTMISGLTALEELLVSGRYGELAVGVFATAQFVFPSLERLFLIGAGDWNEFIRCVYLPSLHSLELSRCAHVKVDGLLRQLQPTDPQLTHLAINGTAFTESELISCVDRIPSLVQVDITRSADLTNAFIQTLLQSPSTRFPKLDHLNFSRCTKISGGPLLRLVRSRLQSVSRWMNLKG